MASRRAKLLSAVMLAVAGSGYFVYTLFAAQAQNSTLAQAPMNNQVQVTPAFIMAVDDSGSMTFHNQFLGADGYACWSGGSFFEAAGELRASGGTCSFAYSYTGARIGTGYYGIPPVDNYGFARSPDFNPAYFDPETVYEPWLTAEGTPYGATAANPAGNASTSSTRMDPRNASPAFNLAAQLEDANGRSRFQLLSGMWLPGGTRYRLVGNNSASCGGLWNGNSSAWQTVGTSGHQVTNTCAAYIGYWPATFYLRERSANVAPRISAAGYNGITPVRIQNACGTGCHLWRYRITTAHQAALQNFANWYSYYGNRQLSMIAGMTRSLATVNDMRIGYFTINSGGRSCGNSTCYDSYSDVVMRDMTVPAQRSALYESMLALPASGSTPNLPATNHMGVQFQRTDAGAPVQLACQRNAGMLFTDGFSNVSFSAPAVSGLGQPFDPTPANTLAAIASKYYFSTSGGASPLRTDLPAGKVPVPKACASLDPSSVEWKRLDCQSHLHMNFYGITLGGRGNLFDPDAAQDPYALNPDWPSYSGGTRSTVDDIWHATVNTRGDFINARTPADIVQAMRRILASVSAGASPSGSIAITGTRIGSGSLTVTPGYRVENEGTDWSSTLTASTITLDQNTRIPETRIAWEASTRFPTPAARTVFFSRGGSVQSFNSTNVSIADLCALSGCTAAEVEGLGRSASLANAVAYLRGDTSLEKRNGGAFRDRTTRLGDIVNSTPVVSAPSDDYGYGMLEGSLGSTYRTYLKETKASRRYMVYVGANDGMLHAFDGGLTRAMADAGQAPDSSGGQERFAYIPSTALGHMGNLLFPYDPVDENDQKFRHRYYVDGPVSVSDAHYGGGWKTVLVGTSGAGGRSVFALDVSSPDAFGSSSRLWEISPLSTSLDAAVRENIGHVLGKPVVVPVKGAGGSVTWKAIFGNGYESASGKAVLFLVDIASGTPNITMIEAQEETSGLSSTSRNGLGNIVVVDRWRGAGLSDAGRDGYADTVYAADQQGAIWKFDLRGSSPANVSIPVFKTQEHTEDGQRYRQPVLGGLTAASGAGGGVMLYFGTGSFSFYHDPTDTRMQSLYAVNDLERGETTATVALDELVQYTVATLEGSDRTVLRQASPPSPSLGWYVDLPAGERFVGYPAIASGVVFMPTYTPDASASGCSTDGFNALFGLNARTGAPGLSRVHYGAPGSGVSPSSGTASVALDTGGSAPVKDVGVLTIPRAQPPEFAPPESGPPSEPPAPPEQGCWMMVTVAGVDPMYLPYPCGRQSWRQIQ